MNFNRNLDLSYALLQWKSNSHFVYCKLLSTTVANSDQAKWRQLAVVRTSTSWRGTRQRSAPSRETEPPFNWPQLHGTKKIRGKWISSFIFQRGYQKDFLFFLAKSRNFRSARFARGLKVVLERPRENTIVLNELACLYSNSSGTFQWRQSMSMTKYT